MASKDMETTHDLAQILEEVANALRAMPPIPLEQKGEFGDDVGQVDKIHRDEKSSVVSIDYAEFAISLTQMARDNAQEELQSITVDGIRSTAAALGIRVPSKIRKSDAVDLVLAQLFDVPAGQELLRTFHERNTGEKNAPVGVRPPNRFPTRNEMKR